jgi:hypothetical protein
MWIYRHTYIHACMHAFFTHIHAYIQEFTEAEMKLFAEQCAHVDINTYMHACIFYIHTYIHTYRSSSRQK